MKTKSIFILLSFVFVITSCKKEVKCVDGNGDLLQETRQLDLFSAVNAYSDANLFYAPGAESKADMFAESNIIPLIITDVNGQILSISVNEDECYNASATPEITLSAPDCYEFNMYGSGKLESHGINRDYYKISVLGSGIVNSSFTTHKFIVTSEGSGDINLAGTAVESNISLFGSGNIYAKAVATDSCLVISDGSGDITLSVTTFLSVTLKGSGNVYYTGSPEVDSLIIGSGHLIKQD
jgi:hypothetical protein